MCSNKVILALFASVLFGLFCAIVVRFLRRKEDTESKEPRDPRLAFLWGMAISFIGTYVILFVWDASKDAVPMADVATALEEAMRNTHASPPPF
jgi:Na+/melibiose symporter-like transporter